MDAEPMFPDPRLRFEPPDDDSELCSVFWHLRALDEDGKKTAEALRRTFDMLLDGQHTGRYRWEQLHKTEKTHFGTLVEINMQRAFQFEDGKELDLDYRIEGVDVDCKFSQNVAEWMIPPEAFGEILLGLWASDKKGQWCMGLVRAKDELLTSENRDRKKRLTADGRGAVAWLHYYKPLPENVLLRLPEEDVDAIFAAGSGQKKVNELFRRAQGRVIRRNVVATVAQQDDYMKRVRGNGGARTHLRPEGIVIFGHFDNHASLARRLDLPYPGPGEFVSARLARRTPSHGNQAAIELEGEEWVLARESDPVEAAPTLPRTTRGE